MGHTASAHIYPDRSGSCRGSGIVAGLCQTPDTNHMTRKLWGLLTIAVHQGLCSVHDTYPPHPAAPTPQAENIAEETGPER